MKRKWKGILITVLFLMGIGFLVLQFDSNAEQYTVEMPELEAVTCINYQKEGGKTVVEDAEGIGNLYGHLQNMSQKTIYASVSDQPVDAFGVIRVEFRKKDNTASMFYFYQKKGKYYMEQPYNGIYSISRKDYEIIDGYAV